ncbi:MAG: Mbov_0396 family ICE element transmembrane protein [Christensenellales bacterium]
MLIFFQELILQLFLWLLKMIDGIMDIFGAMTGITSVMYHGEKVNIIEYLVNSTGVSTIFWCVFILAVGLTCIFTIVAIVKNMIANNKNITSILGRFFLALLGTMAMLVVVILGILISNALLVLVAHIFQVENTTKLSTALFDACVGDWLNGYTIAEVNINELSVRDIFGNWNGTPLFGIWPTHWEMDGMVNPDTFMYLPAMVASIAVIIVMIVAALNLAKRVYEIVLLYITMPISMSTLPLDDGARFKVWRETFITKIVIAYGTVFAVNVFILLLPIITKMRIESLGNFGNTMFHIFMIIGGAMLVPAGQTLFARLFGQADDMHAGGSFLRSAFYGGRIAGALTFGAAGKIIHAASHSRHHNNEHHNNNSESDSSEHYSESDTSGDSGGESE